MKYLCIKNCVINKTPTTVNSIVEVNDNEAKMLLGIGRIVPFNAEPMLENRSIGLENSPEVVVKRRGRPRKNDG